MLSPTPQIASPQSIQEKGVFIGVSNNVVILSFISTIFYFAITLIDSLGFLMKVSIEICSIILKNNNVPILHNYCLIIILETRLSIRLVDRCVICQSSYFSVQAIFFL